MKRPKENKAAISSKDRLNVRHDKRRKRFYIRIPKKLRPLFSKPKFEFEFETDAQNFAATENGLLDEAISLTDMSSAVRLWQLCCKKYRLKKTLVEIVRDVYENLKLAAEELTLEMIRTAFVTELSTPGEGKRNRSYISKISNLPLPWPGMRLSVLMNWREKRTKIKALKLFINSRVDFFTGLLWDSCTKRNYLTYLSAVIGYGIRQSETPLTRNPFYRAIKYNPKFIPEIFDHDDVQFFLTYLWNWEPLLYLAFVFGTWGGLRTAELKRLTFGMLANLTKGELPLDAKITKKDRRRTILVADIPHLFVLCGMLPPGWQTGKDDELIFRRYDIDNLLFDCWRKLMGKPWPSNAMRHMAASNLLVFTNPTRPDKLRIETCQMVLGHKFGEDKKANVLFDHYFSSVTPHQANWFYAMLPQLLTDELEAAYKWRFYTGGIDLTRNTRMWPNHAMECCHNVATNRTHFVNELKSKRPIFATAVKNILRVETLWPDGSRTTTEIRCVSAPFAQELQHRWRVAVYTGQGVLDYETGQVHYYERNFGPLWKQKLYTLHNPEEIERAILKQQELTPPPAPDAPNLPPPAARECTGVLPVAAKLGCATNLLTSYMRVEPQPKSDYSPYIGREAIPERFMAILKRLFPNLVFTETEITNKYLKRLSAGAYPYCLEVGPGKNQG